MKNIYRIILLVKTEPFLQLLCIPFIVSFSKGKRGINHTLIPDKTFPKEGEDNTKCCRGLLSISTTYGHPMRTF